MQPISSRRFNWDNARVSTSDQSCERQLADLTAFAVRGGYEVVATFTETASGTLASRAARNRILDLAQARAGWKVSVVAMSGMTFELGTPHGRMMATLLAGIAQFERAP